MDSGVEGMGRIVGPVIYPPCCVFSHFPLHSLGHCLEIVHHPFLEKIHPERSERVS